MRKLETEPKKTKSKKGARRDHVTNWVRKHWSEKKKSDRDLSEKTRPLWPILSRPTLDQTDLRETPYRATM